MNHSQKQNGLYLYPVVPPVRFPVNGRLPTPYIVIHCQSHQPHLIQNNVAHVMNLNHPPFTLPVSIIPEDSDLSPNISSSHRATTPYIARFHPDIISVQNNRNNVVNTRDTNVNVNIIRNIADEYKCSECSKSFRHKTNLKIHLKIHSEDAFICNFCDKKFARKSNLKQHLRVHTGEKPFKCTICDKSYKQSHSLLDHIRTHTGEKPFKCEFCSKSFSTRCNYVVHRRVHTGEKPYSCTICNKRFTSKSGYNAHKNSRH